MALNFPSNPALNDTYTFSGKSWIWNGYAWTSQSVLAGIKEVTGEPLGFINASDSQISFNDATRTFQISPVTDSFSVFCKTGKFTYNEATTVVLPDTTGLYYIYFNTVGQLSYKTTYFDWPNDAMVAYVYWNSSTSTATFVADERHGVTLDWQTHEYLHRTRGAAFATGFSASGYVVGGDGTQDAHAQLSLAGGTFFDEDLEVAITHSDTPTPNTWEQDLQGPAKIPVFYLSGSGWVMDTPTNFPLKLSSGTPGYNLFSGGTWSVSPVLDGKYATTWILATNNINYPVIAVIGQSSSDNAGQAEATQFSDLQLPGFPVFEYRPLYKLIFRVALDYTNSVNARLDSIWDLRVVDAVSSESPVASDHGNLSGLGDDDHQQYVHIDIARTISANHSFTGQPTTTTPTTGDNSARIASTQFVQTAIAAVIDAAPETLNTLNELAAALGDDANFATTVTTSLSNKQPLNTELTAIAALSGTGLLKKTGVGTWSFDTNTYLTSESDPVFSASAASGISQTEINNWNTAYGWGNHASASYLTTSAAATTYQTKDDDLTAIAGLAGTSGLLKKTAANSWTLDTATYLTANQTITLSGDLSGSGTTSISATLANSGVSAGVYGSSTQIPVITVDAKGRITSASTSSITVGAGTFGVSIGVAATTGTALAWGTASGFTANTSSNYTYDLRIGPALTNLVALMTSGNTGFIKRSGQDTYVIDTSIYLTGTKVDSISGTAPIAVSAATGAVTISHDNSGVTPGTYNNVTVNATGHVTGGSNVSYLTSYSETDTLATVTARGNTTTTTITHGGLVPSAGTNIDQIYSATDSLTLSTAWQDTSVNASELATGSYIVQVLADDYAVGGQQYSEYYTGIMSWFAGGTNSTTTDEIVLHRAGHAPNGGTLYLRVVRTSSEDPLDLKLQISGTTANTGPSNYAFKFRRMI